MTLQATLIDDLKAAMRSGDQVQRSVIRLIRAAVQNEEISRGKELDDAGGVEVLARMARQYRESIDQYRQGNRADLMAKEEAELEVLQRYLPPQMSREEVLALAEQAAQEMGAAGPTDKGKVMGRLMPQLRGKADGALVNAVVTELLDSLADA